ncbi:MAG TPA: mucoidy inhibitor MuiA family protein [Ferruginibacter sp.]|nr:mucoidy inhibitor MuiA family protein [Ferruginibacter sp.]
MKILIPKLLMVLCWIIPIKNSKAQASQKIIDSKIEKAIVFLNGAQINRSGKTVVNPGTSEIIFKGISPYINKQSIQVKAEGNFTVLSVVHKLNYLQEQAKQNDMLKVEEQKEALQDKINMGNDLLGIYRNEENLLSKNQAIVAQNTGLRTADLKEAADFHRLRLTELKQKETEVSKSLKKLNAEMAKLNKQQDELNKQASTATSEVVITVESKETANADLTLSYFVDKAGWYPTYDIRVTDILHPITMLYKANVYQSSGEDWKEVKLTLSTADPKQNGEKPNLPTWFLHYFMPKYYGISSATGNSYNPNVREVSGRITDQDGNPVSFATVKIKGTPTGVSADANGNFRIVVPYNASTIVVSGASFSSRELFISSNVMNIAMQGGGTDLKEVVVTSAFGIQRSVRGEENEFSKNRKEASIPLTVSERENSTSFSFDIETPYTILNDGKVATVQMKEMEVAALYEYYCVPKLEQDVFLTAKITDWGDLNLLEGESNLFFEGTFLGKALINPKAAGDTLNISLGRDKNISVKRTRVKEFSKKQFLGSNKIDYRNFEINIRNNKKQTVNLVIEDQFPVSTMKEVEVDRIENKEADLDSETGKMKWTIQLEPAKEKIVGFRYSVKYPKGSNLVLE